jgi:hypothetical protein
MSKRKPVPRSEDDRNETKKLRMIRLKIIHWLRRAHDHTRIRRRRSAASLQLQRLRVKKIHNQRSLVGGKTTKSLLVSRRSRNLQRNANEDELRYTRLGHPTQTPRAQRLSRRPRGTHHRQAREDQRLLLRISSLQSHPVEHQVK